MPLLFLRYLLSYLSLLTFLQIYLFLSIYTSFPNICFALSSFFLPFFHSLSFFFFFFWRGYSEGLFCGLNSALQDLWLKLAGPSHKGSSRNLIRSGPMTSEVLLHTQRKAA